MTSRLRATYRLGDYCFSVDLPRGGELLEGLVAHLETASAESGPLYSVSAGDMPRARFVITRDRCPTSYAMTERGAVEAMLYQVERDAIEYTSYAHIVLHAGAVNYGGTGIVLPGASGSGKTTATALLTIAGFDYLSDEAAVIDRDTGCVRPFPRSLRLEQPTVRFLTPSIGLEPAGGRYTLVPPGRLREEAVGNGCEIGFIVAPRRSTGPTRVMPLPKVEAFTLLMQQCFGVSRLGRDGVALLAGLVERVGTYTLEIGDDPEQISGVVRAIVAAGVATGLAS